VTIRLAVAHTGGLPSARPTQWLRLLVLGVAIVSMAPNLISAQGRGREGNPRDRLNYFYHQRAYPFGKIPPRALQSARARYKARWPGAIPEQSVQGVSSTAGWAPLGPSAISDFYKSAGRVTAIAIDPTNANVIYVGAAQGGVWKTGDGGTSWAPLTDAECSLAIGAVAVDPVTPSVVYAGTGEANGFDSYYGCGVLRSTDGGATWEQLGAAAFDTPTGGAHVSKIVIDRATAGSLTGSTVFAATSVGLYKSTNSGITWTEVLSGLVTDLVADPTNNATLYAGRVTLPGETGVYKSTDGGGSWRSLSAGFPPFFASSDITRIQLAISTSAPSTLYATAAVAGGSLLGVFKSEDSGATWPDLDASGVSCGQCNYDLVISVDPRDRDVVYFGGVLLYLSRDGGANFTQIGNGAIHVDQHAFAFDPRDPSTIFTGNDGGIYKSINQGQSWVSLNADLAIAQFYPGISVSPSTTLDILGGTQDNGVLEYTGGAVWSQVIGGDGGFTTQTGTTAFGECQWNCGPARRDGGPGTPFVSKSSGIDLNEPAAFIPPLVLDPTNPQVLYFGTYSKLYRTIDNGESWSSIVSDLSTGYVRAISIAPSDAQTIYVGGDGGNVVVTADGGASWTSVAAGLPDRTVTDIAVDATDPHRAYVTMSGFLSGHVFRTVDRGASWEDISSSLVDIPVNAILRLPGSGELYIGTDLGVLNSTDEGTTWAPSTTGLPNVAVLDLVFHSATQTIFAATHGRGMFAHRVLAPVVLHGDVNLDGAVSALDAQAILTGVVGLTLPTGWVLSPNGDANCDGRVEALDAQIVLGYVVGLPTLQFCVGTVR